MSTIKFWHKQSNTNQNGKSGTTSSAENGGKTPGGRNWLHQSEALTNGHIVYLVKYLGNTPVDQPKGIEVVKEAIRKLQFTQQLKKAENGSNYKTKKVEITVSIDGVAIQEPRTNIILHQFPLHKISYCADEKGAKKFFSFIAKTGNSPSVPNGDLNSSNVPNGTANGSSDESHECFVFISNKLASDITLTIGQAFDLAYKRYVNESGKSLEVSKLQATNRQLENTMTAYRQRLRDMAEIVSKNDLERLLVRLGLRDILEVPHENGVNGDHAGVNGSKTPDLGIDVSTPSNDNELLIETSTKHFAPIVPPRNLQNQLSSTIEALKPSVGTKLEGLLLNSDSDSDFDPRAEEDSSSSSNGNKITNDLFGFEPPKQSTGQQLFSNNLLSNGFSQQPASPPPLLAPPPKAATPRRSNNGLTTATTNSGQDLFGAIPFNTIRTGFDDHMEVNFEKNESSTGIANPFNSIANIGQICGSNVVLSTSNEGVTSLDFTTLPCLTSTPNSFAVRPPFAATESTINSPAASPVVPRKKMFPVDFLTSAGSSCFETQTASSFSSNIPYEMPPSVSLFRDLSPLHNISINPVPVPSSSVVPAPATNNPFCVSTTQQQSSYGIPSKYDVFSSMIDATTPSQNVSTQPNVTIKVAPDMDPFKDFADSAFNEFKTDPSGKFSF